MKKIYSTLFFIFLISSGYSQGISRDDMLPVFKLLGNEEWKDAFKAANKVIDEFPDDTSDFKSIMNYASILAAAGQISNSEMSYRDLDKHMKKMAGKKLLMAAHPTTVDTSKLAFNTNIIKENDSHILVATTSTNKSATVILCFEELQLKEQVVIKEYDNSNTRCGGILGSYELNPNKSKVWILRLNIIDGTIRKI